MGAENSILDESDVEKEYFQVNDWNLHSGTWRPATSTKDVINVASPMEITVFRKSIAHKVRDNEIHANLGTCLKRFRHPGIVKYVASGRKGEDVYVVTERISPLSKSLKGLSASEICAGLHSVLQALEFCHDRCRVSHNNFGVDSVFVTTDGTWKLAGMEFLCSREECNEEFLQKNRAFRNESRIPPEEKEGRFAHLTKHCHAGDVYALGLFLRDVLEYVQKTEEHFPHARQFLDMVRKKVLSSDPTLRPTVSTLLYHDFFKNDFLDIVTFLKHITLKDDADRQNFFGGLTKRLLCLPEKLVAARLSSPLLARFVLLDASAGRHFLSDFFRPFRGDDRPDEYVEGLPNPVLTVSSYRTYVIPNLVRIFEVLDFNVRMVLLRNFEYYVDLFDLEVLKSKILPQVLLGVKDTNNDLVMSSLHALAYVVPILGGDVVIGRNRCRYFTEAKPKTLTRSSIPAVRNNSPVNNQLADLLKMTAIEESIDRLQETATKVTSDDLQPRDAESSGGDSPADDGDHRRRRRPETPELERSSPDGGEASDADVDVGTVGDSESWSDWEGLAEEEKAAALDPVPIASTSPFHALHRRASSKELGEEFDIVAVAIKSSVKEDDFFADMQPILSKTSTHAIIAPLVPPVLLVRDVVVNVNKRLSYSDVDVEDTPNGTGWGDDLEWTDDLAI